MMIALPYSFRSGLPRSAFAARLGKLALGVTVFVTILSGWGVIAPVIARHRMLPDDALPQGPCAIWFVGSSSIHRWTTMAARMRPWIAHNRGVNGALLPEISSRFANERAVAAPGAIIFYAGENDISARRPGDMIARDLAGLVQEAHRRMPSARLFIVTLKPSPARWNVRREQLWLSAVIRQRIAPAVGATVIDNADALFVDGRLGPFYRDDNIHLNDDGYRRWGGRIRQVVDKTMSEAARTRCGVATGAAA